MPENVPPLRVLCTACGHMGCEHQAEAMRKLAERLQALQTAALAVLTASSSRISEADGFARLQALAKLVGYTPGPEDPPGMPPPQAPVDTERMQREMNRLGDVLVREVEETSPGWTYSLLVYAGRPDPQNGHVLHVSRDRDRAALAIGKWMVERLDAQKSKARS